MSEPLYERSVPVIVWFRNDLRLADNPALTAAIATGAPVVCIYIWSPEEEGGWPPGAASRWWLHHSLVSLSNALSKLGARLIIRRGLTNAQLIELADRTGARRVFWNRRPEPAAIEQEQQVGRCLKAKGCTWESFGGCMLFGPERIRTRSGSPFQVFTPFFKACKSAGMDTHVIAEPHEISAWHNYGHGDGIGDGELTSLSVDALRLLPSIDWAGGMRNAWNPGEAEAQSRLAEFMDQSVDDYQAGRDFPAVAGVSRLSPALHFGEISPRQAVAAAIKRREFLVDSGRDTGSVDGFIRQVHWREFAYHLLIHFPHTVEAPLRAEFAEFPWSCDAEAFSAWTRGRTGYPFVDAGMRELWTTGYMHNRVRMVASSFLVKDLLISWQEGARWFWDTLVDADLANNTLGWQWVAGCGADAAPYFRIFNPVTQGEKFDPSGEYIRKWLPDLAEAAPADINCPWTGISGLFALENAEETDCYPSPIIQHDFARTRALAALQKVKESTGK